MQHMDSHSDVPTEKIMTAAFAHMEEKTKRCLHLNRRVPMRLACENEMVGIHRMMLDFTMVYRKMIGSDKDCDVYLERFYGSFRPEDSKNPHAKMRKNLVSPHTQTENIDPSDVHFEGFRTGDFTGDIGAYYNTVTTRLHMAIGFTKRLRELMEPVLAEQRASLR